MTVSTTVYFTDWSAANGVNKDWSYDFNIGDETEVQVLVRDGTDDTTIQVFVDNFQLTKIGDGDEGFVTYPVADSALAAGKQVRIRRIVQLVQTTEIGNEGDFRPQLHERTFDKLVKMIQQVSGGINGSLKRLGDGEGYTVLDLTPDRAIVYQNGYIQSGPLVTEIGNAQGYSEAAKLYRDQTQLIKEDVIELKDNTEGFKEDAELARDRAYEWANNPEDAAVTPGNYSSYHWSRKSRLWAIQAEDVEIAPGEYSAYHWAKKAEEVVAAGVADGSITLPKLSSDVIELIETNVRYLASGDPLPSENIGPIFHEDYGGILTWKIFNANGANYEGYASVDIGMFANHGASVAPTGWLKRNGAMLLKADFPALWNWALHSGLVVAWAAGKISFENVDTDNFKLPDTRGYFDRPWADGASMDSGRTFGSVQGDDNKGHTHAATGLTFTGSALPGHSHTIRSSAGSGGGASAQANPSGGGGDGGSNFGNPLTSVSAGTPSGTIGGNTASSGGAESRPHNTAPLGIIKF